GVGQGGRLDLPERLGGGDGRDQAGAVTLVIAQPVDVNVVRRAGRVVDLEVDRLTVVHADVGGEPLDARVAGAEHAPGTLRRPGQLVLGDDAVARDNAVLQRFQAEADDAARFRGRGAARLGRACFSHGRAPR